jgi:hypothetical protein
MGERGTDLARLSRFFWDSISNPYFNFLARLSKGGHSRLHSGKLGRNMLRACKHFAGAAKWTGTVGRAPTEFLALVACASDVD